MTYQEVYGDLISLAKEGKFDVIAHGCNCICTMGAGIAVPMAAAFGCSRFPLEDLSTKGDINKLGQIDYQKYPVNINKSIYVVNAYTQFYPNPKLKPLDYEALSLCLRKINHKFKGMNIGLPQIGAGLAGGDWELIKVIIQKELKDCNVTIVIFKP